MTERTIITCDFCNIGITEGQRLVNAGTYGIHFHEGCINDLSAKDLIVLLNLDDIKIMKLNDWENAIKAPSYWRKK